MENSPNLPRRSHKDRTNTHNLVVELEQAQRRKVCVDLSPSCNLGSGLRVVGPFCWKVADRSGAKTPKQGFVFALPLRTPSLSIARMGPSSIVVR
jgi:hypothetical protein